MLKKLLMLYFLVIYNSFNRNDYVLLLCLFVNVSSLYYFAGANNFLLTFDALNFES